MTAKKVSTKSRATVQDPITLGEKVFIRTVTQYYTGLVVGITERAVLLQQAAWVACTKRFHVTMETGEVEEVEVYPSDLVVSVYFGSMVDSNRWNFDLPRKSI